MNTKVLVALLGLVAAVSVNAVSPSSSASGSKEIAPQCEPVEMVQVTKEMTTNKRKKECETALNVKEMLRAKDTRALCSITPCTTALKELYIKLPDCSYIDWPVRYHAGRWLKQCGIKPEEIDASTLPVDSSGSDGSDTGSNDVVPPDDWASSSPSDVSFAPIPTVPPATTTPTPSGIGSASGMATTAVAIAVAVGVANVM